MENSVDKFVEQLRVLNQSKVRKQFVKRKPIDKIYCGFEGNHGTYQMIPFNDVINNFPYTTLQGTKEINMPIKNIGPDGVEKEFRPWIHILPDSAYVIKDDQGNIVSSLNATQAETLNQARLLFDQLYEEIGGYDVCSKSKTLSKFIRKKNYTIWNAHVINFFKTGDTKTPLRSGFDALFVCTARGFIEAVEKATDETNVLNPGVDWYGDIYNRNQSDRKGFAMFTITKSSAHVGFDIVVRHQLDQGKFCNGISISDEGAELMSNPIEQFLSWQAAPQEEGVPAEKRCLFNDKLMKETISFLTDQIAKVRVAKENGQSIEEAIDIVNKDVYNNQKPTNNRGVETNDPVLVNMSKKIEKDDGPYSYKASNPAEVMGKMENPYTNPPAAHLDPVSGSPKFGESSSDDLPF